MYVRDNSSVGVADENDRWGIAGAADLTDAELSMTVFASGDPLDAERIAMNSKPATVGVMCTTPLICKC